METARTILGCVQFSEPVELNSPNALIKWTKCFKNMDSVTKTCDYHYKEYAYANSHDPLSLSLLLFNVTTQNKCLQISLNLLTQMLYSFLSFSEDGSLL